MVKLDASEPEVQAGAAWGVMPLVVLVNARIQALEAQLARVPVFSWAMPEAHLPAHLQVGRRKGRGGGLSAQPTNAVSV